MYTNTTGTRFDHDYYRDEHMPLVRANRRIQFYTVDKASPQRRTG